MNALSIKHQGVRANLPRISELFKSLDARYFQIVFLVSLLLFGALARDFSLTIWQVLLTFCSAVGTQAVWQFALKLPNRHNISGYLSALVSTCQHLRHLYFGAL